MKKWFLAIALLLCCGFAQAQNTSAPLPVPGGICFVNSQRVLEAHPDGAKVFEARNQAAAELQPIQQQIQALQAKIQAGTASAAERQQYDTLVRTYQARAKVWQDKINALLGPITREVDATVALVAPQRGCAVVFDRSIAASSGLVIYADPSTDITDAVIAALPKR